ncbi:Rieske (2Fe-2S) protein [Dyella mobilis]|uniref:Rieske (2Fe-2S) protein n=1 Tax=Dyella mobilis TaxID=1849582 RepID=A0ABS2KIP9_9GAMM|nr:Rieske (2Fe-2S) protein [Dyella mobilis]MBM7130268.1 Rieske (2Fe-2S) protein [Dyella mobilis]GLQ96894.1 ferredoxin [Dyella mobilis]
MDTATSPRRLCRLDDMPDGEAMALDVSLPEGEESVILLRQGARVNAWLNICPHAGRRLDWAPGKFLISKGMLVCAAHGACFNVDNGECIGGPCKGESLRTVPVQVEQGDVLLDV